MTHNRPHSKEAECAILGTMIKSADLCNDCLERLTEQSFYIPSHQRIFSAIGELVSDGQPVDEITLTELLERKKELKQSGGLKYVMDLPREIPAISNITHYVDIVVNKHKVRQLIEAAENIIKKALAEDEDTEKLLAYAEKSVFDVSQQNIKTELREVLQDWPDVYLKIGDRSQNKTGITGLKTHFYDLDNCTAGLQKSDLIVLAARPGVGKTAFALNIALNAATKDKKQVAIFSLEMSREQLIQRLACSYGKMDMSKVKHGNIEGNDYAQLIAAFKGIERDIFIDDTGGISLSEIASKLRRQKLKHGCDIAIIDYLQLIQPSGKSENRNLEVAKMTRDLKIMAKDLDMPILLLAQLSRKVEERGDRRPMLSHLRDSGAIEQDADMVMFLHRESMYSENANENEAELIIAKHRNGSLGTAMLNWEGRYTTFYSLYQAQRDN